VRRARGYASAGGVLAGIGLVVSSVYVMVTGALPLLAVAGVDGDDPDPGACDGEQDGPLDGRSGPAAAGANR